MGDSLEFYNFFYNDIENRLAHFINTDSNLRNIISIEDQKKHILNNIFETQYNIDNCINMINNNLSLYLQMVEFVKNKDSPYMPGLIDFTKVSNVFNRFFYHYAKLCMNNECAFCQNIHIRVLNIQYVQN
jgi:hypothetical protein